MKKCPYCGKENTDDAVVCVKCRAGFPNDEMKPDNVPDEPVRQKRKRSE